MRKHHEEKVQLGPKKYVPNCKKVITKIRKKYFEFGEDLPWRQSIKNLNNNYLRILLRFHQISSHGIIYKTCSFRNDA